ncbi:hypothetical protein TRSC58_07476 [Trypanosoma rangeli SC58]|uniref:Uncharacterized protein n=1 Tax=Trypanosoma rangeli SC58 TaxID=429131 RepID=A0A061ISR6_TRYRA|nr:hypothetical protein TRSC58_07476 [Trypanosoma rangeli SC58]
MVRPLRPVGKDIDAVDYPVAHPPTFFHFFVFFFFYLFLVCVLFPTRHRARGAPTAAKHTCEVHPTRRTKQK